MHRAMLDRTRWIPAVAVASALLTLAGCDGGVAIQGRVYVETQADPRAGSRVLEVEPNGDSRMKPLTDAHVVLFRSPLAERGQTDAWKSEMDTDARGEFQLSGACAPNRREFSIQISKQGFQTVKYRFRTSGHLAEPVFVVLAADR